MSQDQNQISLVIPSYRRGAKIAATMHSVFTQTRLPDEVLVVNDGGFAETGSWLAEHYPQVRVLDIEHSGAALARNKGVEATRYPILMLLDDDDSLLPNAVETLVKTLTLFPEARAAYANHGMTNLITGERFEDTHAQVPMFARIKKIPVWKEKDGVRLYDRAMYYALLHGNLFQQPWITYRQIYLDVGGFQPGCGSADDWDLYLRITRRFSVAQTDQVVSEHFIEKGRQHLTLAPQQLRAQMVPILKQLGLAGWSDPRATWVLRKRLGIYYKTFGDEAYNSDLKSAWNNYWRSFWTWPFDPVVALRTWVFWPARRLFGSAPAKTQVNQSSSPGLQEQENMPAARS